MKPLLYALLALPLTNAWTFRYTNATNNATILHETGTLNCTQIDLAGGKLFSWDPEDAKLCISIYYDTKCQNRGGISCPFWKKNASTNFYGIEVYTDEQAVSATVSTATPSQTTSISTPSTAISAATTSPTRATTTTPAADSNASSASSLSGGAIAGIAIGVVSGVLVFAGLLFFLGRRRRRNAALMGSGNSPQGPYGPNTAGLAEAPTSSGGVFEKPAGSRPAPGSRVVELAGQDRATELANNPLSELDGQNETKFH